MASVYTNKITINILSTVCYIHFLDLKNKLTLGKDIQVIFVEPENSENLLSFLREHRLADKVTLIERKHFEEATKLHELASDYLNDVVSRKKITSCIFDY